MPDSSLMADRILLNMGQTLDYETRPTYSVRVKSRDLIGNEVEKVLTLSLTGGPTDMVLSANTIQENLAAGSTIGSLSTMSPVGSSTFTYALVSGTGSSGNSNFTIDANGNLKNAASFDFETAGSYSIRVRSTDQNNQFIEEVFTISVLDMPEMIGGAIVGDGTAQRSLVKQVVLTFDGALSFEAGAFAVSKRGAGGGPVVTTVNSALNGAGHTLVTLSFSGALTRGLSGALSDGYYQLTIDGTKISRLGKQLDANRDGVGGDNFEFGTLESDRFFAMYGDTTGDGIVSVAEFGQFRTSFGKTELATRLQRAL